MLDTSSYNPRNREGCSSIPRAVVNSITDALVDQIECGLVVCDSRGRLLHANRSARREMNDGRVLRLAHDALQVDPDSHADLAAALHDAAIRQRSRLLWLGVDDQQLMIVVRPIAIEGVGNAQTALIVLGPSRPLFTARPGNAGDPSRPDVGRASRLSGIDRQPVRARDRERARRLSADRSHADPVGP